VTDTDTRTVPAVEPAAVARQIGRRRPDKTGRRSRIYDHLAVTALLQGLTGGMSVDGAARLAGLAPDTVYGWIGRAETEKARRDRPDDTPQKRRDDGEPRWEDEEPFVLFSDAFAQARASFEQEAMGVVRRVMHGGILKREVTRTFTNAGGEQVTEFEREVSLPDGKLALMYLERTRPGYVKPPVKAEVTGPGGAPVQTAPQGAPDAEVVAALAVRVAQGLQMQREAAEAVAAAEAGDRAERQALEARTVEGELG